MTEFWPIDKVVPAAYNPRKIEDERIDVLKESLDKLGFIVPILVNKENNTIIAGHQRTKTARLSGLKEVPVNVIENITLGDEITFNQIHNSVELSLQNKPKLLFGEFEKEKFIQIPHENFEKKMCRAASLKEICSLLMKYGNCMSCVVCKNEVLYGAEYMKACQMLKLPVNTYICDDSKYKDIKYYMTQDYGRFSYESIERHTYVQGLAQTVRNTGGGVGPAPRCKSWLYTRWCIPYCKQAGKGTRVLDFGCGKGAYIPKMNELGYPTTGVEFYNHNGAAINIRKGNEQIDNLIDELKTNGLFDVSFCSSVMNSVDSLEAEDAVLSCLSLFTKDKIFFSGRTLDYDIRSIYTAVDGTNRTYYHYLDADNFTAVYRQGHWFFQKFHNREQIEKLCADHKFKILALEYSKNKTTWNCYCEKIEDLPEERYKKAVEFEFGLALPNGKHYNRANDVWNAIKPIYGYKD